MDKGFFFNLDADKLTKYFEEEREETNQLEFKSGRGCDISVIYKEICAFANTDGGTLIFGTPEEVSSTGSRIKRKVCRGKILPTSLTKTNDDILSSISSNITPMPEGIEIKHIEFDSGLSYIINVPASTKKPHCYQGTYYIRINTKSEPAPHGIVEALFNQKTPANLDVRVYCDEIKTNPYEIIKELYININNDSDYPVVGVEGFIIIVGNISQGAVVIRKVGDALEKSFLSNGYTKLTAPFIFELSLIKELTKVHTIERLYFNDEYFYAKVYVWARDTKPISKLFRVYNNNFVEEVDINQSEYQHWSEGE